jgi:hypothetical protein
MTKGLYIAIVYLSMILSAVANVHAGPMKSQENYKQKMNAHIGKMKIKNPIKYEEMVKRAGENITDCLSCHVEASQKNILPTHKPPKKF